MSLTTALPATSGGTGQSSYAVGDLLYASSTTALSKLTAGATNTILTISGGVPQWTSATAILQLLYPVGSVYLNATNATNPGTLLGFGTWVAFGAGRVPVGFDSTNVLFDTAEETGGSADAVVVSHTHTITDPGHSHTTTIPTSATGNSRQALYSTDNAGTTATITSSTATTGISVNTTGSSGTNANYQPYITVYMWKRTA
jgi:microcystin-dependent protein